MEFTNGRTEEHTQDNGKIIICMEKEFILGQMAEDMKVNMKWIKSMAMVFTSGQMVEYTKVIGSMGNSMGKENTCYKMALSK